MYVCMDGCMGGWMDGWKDSGLKDQKRLHERGGTEPCLSVWRQRGKGTSYGSTMSQKLSSVHGPREEVSLNGTREIVRKEHLKALT